MAGKAANRGLNRYWHFDEQLNVDNLPVYQADNKKKIEIRKDIHLDWNHTVFRRKFSTGKSMLLSGLWIIIFLIKTGVQ